MPRKFQLLTISGLGVMPVSAVPTLHRNFVAQPCSGNYLVTFPLSDSCEILATYYVDIFVNRIKISELPVILLGRYASLL